MKLKSVRIQGFKRMADSDDLLLSRVRHLVKEDQSETPASLQTLHGLNPDAADGRLAFTAMWPDISIRRNERAWLPRWYRPLTKAPLFSVHFLPKGNRGTSL